jgi:hypothetical protein
MVVPVHRLVPPTLIAASRCWDIDQLRQIGHMGAEVVAFVGSTAISSAECAHGRYSGAAPHAAQPMRYAPPARKKGSPRRLPLPTRMTDASALDLTELSMAADGV